MKPADFYISRIKGFEDMDFEERRFRVEYECLEHSKVHTKTTLKELFRVKPKPDAVPIDSYINDYNMEICLYHYEQCVPMKRLSKKPRTAAQKAATKKMLMAASKNTPRRRAIEEAKRLVNSGAVVIDTETTDLNGVAIQIAAVCCKTRKVLYSSLIKTDVPIAAEAQSVHGITSEMLADAPSPDAVFKELKKVLFEKELVAFNAKFDKKICLNTFSNGAEIFDKNWSCAMLDVAVPVVGSTNRYGTISLSNAMYYADVEWTGSAHSASGDALATVDLIRKIAAKS